MRDYDDLVKSLRYCAEYDCTTVCPRAGTGNGCITRLKKEAADAIEELSNAQKQWIEQERNALLKSIPRWIPVTERCPEKSGDYLVVDNCRNLYVNEWHCLLKKWQYDDRRITHWMPLPEPPKEET